MNPVRETAILGLTMLAGFAVPFGLGAMWQSRQAEPTLTPERAAVEPPTAPPSNREPRPIQLMPADASHSGAVQATSNQDARQSPASVSSAPGDSALPVQIRFRHINNIIQGMIVNVSDADLDVDAHILNSGTQQSSQRMLHLSAKIPTPLGVGDGIELHPADEVTLRSAAHREFVATVP